MAKSRHIEATTTPDWAAGIYLESECDATKTLASQYDLDYPQVLQALAAITDTQEIEMILSDINAMLEEANAKPHHIKSVRIDKYGFPAIKYWEDDSSKSRRA